MLAGITMGFITETVTVIGSMDTNTLLGTRDTLRFDWVPV